DAQVEVPSVQLQAGSVTLRAERVLRVGFELESSGERVPLFGFELAGDVDPEQLPRANPGLEGFIELEQAVGSIRIEQARPEPALRDRARWCSLHGRDRHRPSGFGTQRHSCPFLARQAWAATHVGSVSGNRATGSPASKPRNRRARADGPGSPGG